MDQTQTCSLAFTGDIAFSGYFKEKYDHVFDDGILGFLNTADEVITNVEAPITDSSVDSDRTLNHVNSPKIIDVLPQINSHIWNLGNNHIMDCGETGLNDTLRHCAAGGAAPLGVKDHYSVIREYNGIKIGILSITKPWKHLKNNNGENVTLTWEHPNEIKSLAAQLKEQADWVVAVVHGDDEFLAIPLPDTRRLYHSLLGYGADIIVGHHPHVVQNYEEVNGKIIFYSLGNCVFDTDYQRIQKHSENGMLVKLSFTKEAFSWQCMPIRIDRTNQTVCTDDSNPIFVNIGEKSYKRLWPLAARQYIAANRAAKLYRNPKLKSQSSFKRFVRELIDLKKRKNRFLAYARIFSFLRLYAPAKEKDVIAYLKTCRPASD